MQLNKTLLAVGLLMSLTTLTAEASLTSYTGVGGVGLVYSSVSNVTWTQDANLFKTLYDANNNLINLITAVTPSYNDPSYLGAQAIGDGGAIDDFDTSTGRLSWWGAKAFTNYLNNINYAGSNQWRLPSSNAIIGYNQTGSQFGQLFYTELGGTAGNKIPYTANFTNEQASVYWLAQEYAAYPDLAWGFSTDNGIQGIINNKSNQYYAWAVSPGQVSAVPVPGAIWLMGTGLLGLLGLKRRGHAV